MNKTIRTSFSQNNMFSNCQRQWYYQYILKIPAVSDMCYAHAGSVIHKILEQYYSGKFENFEKAKEHFLKEWKKYKLDDSKIKNKKDNYWLMIVEGVNLAVKITSTELKIFFPDALAYLDIINTTDDIIIDWKSSTRSNENEEEYTMQLKFYSWMYYRKFNRIPSKAIVYYLKYTGSKQELSFEPTEEDLKEAKDWHMNVQKQMLEVKAKEQIPPISEKCNYWCPYKNICQVNSSETLKYTLHLKGNYVFIDGPISDLLHKGLQNKFSYELKNSHWIRQAKPNANTTVNFWDARKRRLPIGFLSGLKKTLGDYAIHMKVDLELEEKDYREFDEMKITMPEKFLNGIVLRDYQTKAADIFLRNKIGILEIATGAGKTEIAIEIIRRLGLRSLFIVDKIELLRQTKERMEAALGITVGQIGQGVTDIQMVTVATVQTITKHLTTLAPYLRQVRFCIMDEAHKVAARSYWRIGNQLINTEYRLGMSGTAFRDDGNDMMINASTGYIIYKLNSKKLIAEGWLVKPQIIFLKNYMEKDIIKRLENETKTGLINETPNYANYYNVFIKDRTQRNALIEEIVMKNEGKRMLILTKLIEHGQMLEEMLPGSYHLYGATNKKERKEMFDNFVKGKEKILISTLSIFAEGINIPSLDIVINAAANKGDVKTIQVLGRVLRKLDGKDTAYYYDFIDETKFFRLASLARKRALIKEGHNVEVIDCQKNPEMK